MSPTVGRPEQRCRPGAREDDIRVRGIVCDLPDMECVHRRVEMFEMLAVIGAGQDGASLFWMDCEAEYPAFCPQTRSHLAPALAAVRADPGAGADGPDADREVIGHGSILR